jgi:hypothetical protein
MNHHTLVGIAVQRGQRLSFGGVLVKVLVMLQSIDGSDGRIEALRETSLNPAPFARIANNADRMRLPIVERLIPPLWKFDLSKQHDSYV